MSLFRSCSCGRHGSQTEHETEERIVEEALLRATVRRDVLSLIGRTTALAAAALALAALLPACAATPSWGGSSRSRTSAAA